MQGLWSWASEKITSIKNGITQTYSSVMSTIHYITSIPSLRNYTYSFSIKWWEGFSRVFDPTNVTKMFTSPKTRHALKESFKANVFYYLSLAMLLELTREKIAYALESDTEESWSSVSNSINMVLSMTINISLGTIMLHRLYDNALINLSLSKSVIDENPMSDNYKHCGCDDGALISAGLFSTVNLMGKKISIEMASYMPIFNYLAPICYMFADGESLAEYPLSSVGMCTKHRAEMLVKNNPYSLGIGCSLYLMSTGGSFAISWLTGLESFFISNAVNAIIYPYFITSVLLREKKIPGEINGFDFFHYHRNALQSASGYIGKQILPTLQQNNNKANSWNGCHLFLMSNKVDIFKISNKACLYLYKDNDEIFYHVAHDENKVYLNEKVVHEILKDVNFDQHAEDPISCNNKEIRNVILDITSTRGHTYWKSKWEKIGEYQLVKMSKWGLSQDVYGNWQSMKSIETSPSTILFFNVYYPLIKQQLNNIIRLREQSYIGKVVPVLPVWFTDMVMSEDYKALIKILFDKNLDSLLKKTRKALADINLIQEAAQTKATIYNMQEWQKSLEQMNNLTSKRPKASIPSTPQIPVAKVDAVVMPDVKPQELLLEDKDVHLSEKKEVVSPVDEVKIIDKPKLYPRNRDLIASDSGSDLSRSGSKEIAVLGLFSSPPLSVQKEVVEKKRRTLSDFIVNEDYRQPDDASADTQLKRLGGC